MHIMGLQDRVELWRARKTGDSARQLAVPSKPKLVIPPRTVKEPIPTPIEQVLAKEGRDILTEFGVKDRFAEIQSKYWGCGELSVIPGGYRLYISYPELGGWISKEYPSSPSRSYYSEDGTYPEKGHHPPEIHSTPGYPGGINDYSVARGVRHAIVATVGELQRPEASSQTQKELALFVAIGIDPDLFLRGDSNKSFNAESSRTLDPAKIQAAIRKLGSGKYTPEGYSPIDIYLNAREVYLSEISWGWHLAQSSTAPNLVAELFQKGYIAGPDTDNSRDYVTKPFAPWDIFARSSNPAEFDDFLAEYIVDAGLDQISIRQAIGKNSQYRFTKNILPYKE